MRAGVPGHSYALHAGGVHGECRAVHGQSYSTKSYQRCSSSIVYQLQSYKLVMSGKIIIWLESCVISHVSSTLSSSLAVKKERGVISEDGEYPPPEDKGGNRFTPWWYKTLKISDPLSSSCQLSAWLQEHIHLHWKLQL